MSEENIYVDTLITEDMSKDELYDYAKYLEYRKEELLNINHSLQQKVEQLEKENNKKLYTSNHNQFTKYELLDDYERILKINKQLENIRKEIKEYIEKDKLNIDESQCYVETQTGWKMIPKIYDDLLNILNKGSE